MLFVEPIPISAIALRLDGGLLAAMGRGFAFFAVGDCSVQWLGTVDVGDRMNDGACDPLGRFLAGTTTYDRSPRAALYRLDPDLSITPVLAPVTLSNGIDWSPDGRTLYYVDTPLRRVDAFAYDVERGELGERRVLVDLADAPGNPDGLSVDAEGHIWVAIFRGGEIRRYMPDGRLVHTVAVPTPLVTSCCFGGPDLTDLYITSSARAMTDEERALNPLAGALFRYHTDTNGMNAHRFRG